MIEQNKECFHPHNRYHMLAQWWMKVSILSPSCLRQIMYKKQAYSESLQKIFVTCYCFSGFPLTGQFPYNHLSEIKRNKFFQGLCRFLNLKDCRLQNRDRVQFSNVRLTVKVTEETGNLHVILPVSPLFSIFISWTKSLLTATAYV